MNQTYSTLENIPTNCKTLARSFETDSSSQVSDGKKEIPLDYKYETPIKPRKIIECPSTPKKKKITNNYLDKGIPRKNLMKLFDKL